MGGQDKGLVEYQGKPLAKRVADAVRDDVGQLIAVANRNQSEYQQFVDLVVEDSVPGFEGPVVGLLTGLTNANTEWVLFLPCDLPALPAGYCQAMAVACQASSTKVAVVVDDDQRQNTLLLLHSSLHDSLKAYFDAGGRSIKGWLNQQDVAEVEFPEFTGGFRNLNTPEALHE